jgi:3-dehydroquinate synthase
LLSGFLAEAAWRRIIDLLIALHLPVSVPELDAHLDTPDHPRSVLRGLAEFREHLGGELTLMMLGDIGRAFDVHEVHTEGMIRSVEILKTIQVAGTSAAASGAIPAAASARGSS